MERRFGARARAKRMARSSRGTRNRDSRQRHRVHLRACRGMTRRTGMRPLRIAMIGQKGIPARYGGVETHVEAVASRLVERGHEVWAFCRSRLRPGADGEPIPEGYHANGSAPEFRGVRLAYRPSLHTKHTDAASHTFLCALEASC